MKDYTKSKIYKIIDNTNGNIYIGSTTQPISRRLTKHKSDYKQYVGGKFGYVSSFEIIKNGDYKIEVMEEFTCNKLSELRDKEFEYIKNNKCVNQLNPNNENIERLYINNDEYKLKKREYDLKYNVKENCLCGGKYTLKNRTCHERTAKHKKYIENQNQNKNN